MTKRAESPPRFGPLLSFLAVPYFADWGSTYYGLKHGLIEANPLWADTSIWFMLLGKILVLPIILGCILFLYRFSKRAGEFARWKVYTIFSFVTVHNVYLVNQL